MNGQDILYGISKAPVEIPYNDLLAIQLNFNVVYFI